MRYWTIAQMRNNKAFRFVSEPSSSRYSLWDRSAHRFSRSVYEEGFSMTIDSERRQQETRLCITLSSRCRGLYAVRARLRVRGKYVSPPLLEWIRTNFRHSQTSLLSIYSHEWAGTSKPPSHWFVRSSPISKSFFEEDGHVCVLVHVAWNESLKDAIRLQWESVGRLSNERR